MRLPAGHFSITRPCHGETVGYDYTDAAAVSVCVGVCVRVLFLCLGVCLSNSMDSSELFLVSYSRWSPTAEQSCSSRERLLCVLNTSMGFCEIVRLKKLQLQNTFNRSFDFCPLQRLMSSLVLVAARYLSHFFSETSE